MCSCSIEHQNIYVLDFKPQRLAKHKCPVQHKCFSGSSVPFRTASQFIVPATLAGRRLVKYLYVLDHLMAYLLFFLTRQQLLRVHFYKPLIILLIVITMYLQTHEHLRDVVYDSASKNDSIKSLTT